MRNILAAVALLVSCLAAQAQTERICVTSPSQTANYNQLCISASSSGGLLEVDNFGSATGGLSVTGTLGALTLNAGTQKNFLYGAVATNYNGLSFNNSLAQNSILGIWGGATGVDNLFMAAPSDGLIVFLFGGSTAGSMGSASFTIPTVIVTSASATVSSGQVGFGNTINAAGAGSCPSGTVGGQTVAGCWAINVAGTARNVPFF